MSSTILSSVDVINFPVAELVPEMKVRYLIAKEQLGMYLNIELISDNAIAIVPNAKKCLFFNFHNEQRDIDRIKDVLALQSGVISKYNPNLRPNVIFSKGLRILKQGSSLFVPLSEIGKNPNLLHRIFDTFYDLYEHPVY